MEKPYTAINNHKVFELNDGCYVRFICVHPDDGACLIGELHKPEDEEANPFVTFERSSIKRTVIEDLRTARVDVSGKPNTHGLVQNCPFCRGCDVQGYSYTRTDPDHYFQCQSCTATGPSAPTLAEAAELWNAGVRRNSVVLE